MGRQAKNRAAGECNPRCCAGATTHPASVFAVAAAIAGAALPHRAPAAEASDSSGGLAGSHRHCTQGLGEPAGRADQRRCLHRRRTCRTSASPASRTTSQKIAVDLLHQRSVRARSCSCMRGASDGSNPNYANTSSTGFFLDDMSMSWPRRAAGPAPLRHGAHRGAQGTAGHDLRRRFHVGRHHQHHHQAGRERLQRRRGLRTPGRSRAADRTGPTRASSTSR